MLQNAAKHSGAKNVYLQFIGENNGAFSLVYEDDGKGFDYLNRKKGLGLKNIENRVTLINGSFQIDTSEKGKGTIVVIEAKY